MKNPEIQLNDSTLVGLYASNQDERAISKLIERYKSKIFSVIYNIVKEKEVAEDIMQETFIKAIKTIQQGSYNEEGKFQPWICRIAHNLAIDHFRRGKRYPTVELEERKELYNSLNFSEESIEKVKITEELHSKLNQLVEKLPSKQKEVLVMRHFMDMSFQEIATTTNVSINTALGRMRYALINLRKLADECNVRFGEYLMVYAQ